MASWLDIENQSRHIHPHKENGQPASIDTLLRLGNGRRLAGRPDLKDDKTGAVNGTCVAPDHRLVWQFIGNLTGGNPDMRRHRQAQNR